MSKDISINIKTVIADSGYVSGDIIQELLDRNIKLNIPLFSGISGKRDLEQEGFFYDKRYNYYTCRNGEILTPYPSATNGIFTFHTQLGCCNSCLMQNSCTVKKHNNTSVRSIVHHKHKELFDAVKTEMLNTEFRKNLCERMWKLEELMR